MGGGSRSTPPADNNMESNNTGSNDAKKNGNHVCADGTATDSSDCYHVLRSSAARQALQTYQYQGVDLSLYYKYFASPLAQSCVNLLQRFDATKNLAPNSITAGGLLFMVSSYCVMYFYNPTMQSLQCSTDVYQPQLIPSWCFVFNAICIFVYQTMDNMDGKQARVTRSSSALGLLFDHGCDAINSLFGSVSWMLAVNIVPLSVVSSSFDALLCYIIMFGPYGLFYISTWEEYYTNCLVLPIVNGNNEGLLGAISVNLLTAAYGACFWHQTTAWETYLLPLLTRLLSVVARVNDPTALLPASVRHVDLLLAASTVLLLQEYALKILSVVKTYGVTTLWNLLPFACLTASILILGYRDTSVFLQYPRTISHLIAGLFVDMTVDLMICHVTLQRYNPFRYTLIPLVLWTVSVLLETGSSGDWNTNFHNSWLPDMLLIYTTAVVIHVIHTLSLLIREISHVLNVYCFDITSNPRRECLTAASADVVVQKTAAIRDHVKSE
jgi:ethanolaminephosphotransferase